MIDKKEKHKEYNRKYLKQWHENYPEYDKEYYQRNKDKRLKYTNEWYKTNPKYREKYNKEYYQKNRKEILIYKKKIRESNPKLLNERSRKWRENNLEYVRKRDRELIKTERGKANHQRSCTKRRTKIKEIINTLTFKEWLDILKKYHFKCAYCGKEFDLFTIPERDHIIPISKGGNNIKENIIPACRNCNARKSNKIININQEEKEWGIKKVKVYINE